MAKRALKQLAQRSLRLADLEVTRAGNVPRFDLFFRNLRAYGLAPKTVYDVGVNTGTPRPSSRSSTRLARRCLNERAQCDAWVGYFNVALGDKDEQGQLKEYPPDPGASSLIHGGNDSANHPVQVCRFDSLVSWIAGPALMKIATQGYELKVLHGMGRFLSEIDF